MCVICVTQYGDAGAISSPFFQLCMKSQRAVGKTREIPVTLCFIFVVQPTMKLFLANKWGLITQKVIF